MHGYSHVRLFTEKKRDMRKKSFMTAFLCMALGTQMMAQTPGNVGGASSR